MIPVAGIIWTSRPHAKIEQLDARYLTTIRGMPAAEVVKIMGEHPTPTTGAAAWWDDLRLGSDADAKVKSAIRYTVDTFFLPVTFEFTFDEEGMLVGRHRFD